MLTSKMQVIIAGVLVHLLCYYGLFRYLQPMECGWLFYIVVAFFELIFAMWISINEYLSESEVLKLEKASVGGSGNKDVKYKSDGDYRLAAVMAIAVSVIPVVGLMVAMYFNQNGVYDIRWYHFIGICFLGIVVMYAVPLLQEGIGSMNRKTVGKQLEIKKKSSGSETLDLSFIMHLGNDYSPRISQEVMDGINNLEKTMEKNRISNSKQAHVTIDDYKRAEEVVKEAVHKVTGGRLKNKILLPGHSLVTDLGFTSDLMEKLDVACFSNILVEEYLLFCRWMSDETSKGKICKKTNDHFNNTWRIIYWNMVAKGVKMDIEPLEKPEKVERILPTLGDWYDCAADVIHCAKFAKK